jgi:hypothetical protein
MRRFILCAPFLVAIMFVGTAVVAEDVHSGNYVMLGCRSALESSAPKPSETIFREGLCAGILTVIRELRIVGICVPTEIPNSQVIRVVTQYIDSRPVRLNESFTNLATEALIAAWPCQHSTH